MRRGGASYLTSSLILNAMIVAHIEMVGAEGIGYDFVPVRVKLRDWLPVLVTLHQHSLSESMASFPMTGNLRIVGY